MKNNFYKPLLKHKFVVYGGDHANPLGMVRSLGEMGIAVDVVLVLVSIRRLFRPLNILIKYTMLQLMKKGWTSL